MNRKLIIVEGPPCSGKSTTSRFIAEELGMHFVDEGTGAHPADYEFHAFLSREDITNFTYAEQKQILSACTEKSDGFIIHLEEFSGELFEKLLQRKVYDFLPWETERPVMLDKWHEFVQSIHDSKYVFNCVLLQNPMCETMMRFGFDEAASEAYIRELCDIIKPLSPFVVYLKNSDIYNSVKKASVERGDDWLNAVIDYHCNGAFGKSCGLSGFDGYISALEERQRRELDILSRLDIDNAVIDDPQKDRTSAYSEIISKINEVK